MVDIIKNIHTVQNHIRTLEQRYQRPAGSVELLAVSKFHPVSAIRTAIQGGLMHFGENYLQEALLKISALAPENLTWHFIGHIQSNKTRAIAENFSWVHTIDRLSIAKALNDKRPEGLPPLNVCIQVNLENTENKAGISLDSLYSLATAIRSLPRLQLRGLMTITDPQPNFAMQQSLYQLLSRHQATLNEAGFKLDTLSMGMSQDIEAAISAGSTMLRIGTAIFGPRQTTPIQQKDNLS